MPIFFGTNDPSDKWTATQRTMLAAVQATDERLIAPQYLMQISAHLTFSSSAQKDDSHWGPSPDCRVGVVTPLSPVVPQSPESDVQCAVKCYHTRESLLVSAILYVLFISQFWVAPADCSMTTRLQFYRVSETHKQYTSRVPEHGSHRFARWGHNLQLGRSRRFFVFPLPWSLLCLRLIVMNPSLITHYNPLQHRLPFCLVLL